MIEEKKERIELSDSASTDDLRVIACNAAQGSSRYSRGSLAYVVQLAGDRASVLIHSRSGRWIQTWLSISQLANFRFKNLPPEHPLHSSIGPSGVQEFFSEGNLASLASRGAGQGVCLR
jgi:hypothetical protein